MALRSRGGEHPQVMLKPCPSRDGRAQGRPGAGRTHGPPANEKSWRQSPQVWPNIRPSLRDGFNAVLRALLGDRAFLPPSPRETGFRATWHQRRDARTTRLRRPCSHSLVWRGQHDHRIPASRVVTIARTSLFNRGGMARGCIVFRKTEEDYFPRRGWTVESVLKALTNFDFSRTNFRTLKALTGGDLVDQCA
jgi:hypothetical protein